MKGQIVTRASGQFPALARERVIDMSIPRTRRVKVRAVGELDAEIVRSEEHPGADTLFVHEDLLDVARKRWERMREDLDGSLSTSHTE